MVTEHETWLALTVEEPIDPELPICDPHHHLWDRPNNRYVLEELLQDTGSGHNIVRTVFVECRSSYDMDAPEEMRPVGETVFVEGIAGRSASEQHVKTAVAEGIIGFTDMTLGAGVVPVLEAHLAAGKGRFRGIRHSSVWDASPDITGYRNPPRGLLLDARFREGFSYLQKYNLSFDSWLYHPQLTELADLARACPDTIIIADHIGGLLGIGPYAGKRDEVLQDWKRGITALATCPNVYMKLGGLGMPLCGFGWNERPAPPGSAELAEAMAPYYHFCIEKFGADRCMFESNFPVDKVSYSYNVMWNSFKLIARDFSSGERAALFHDTAVKAYRLTTDT